MLQSFGKSFDIKIEQINLANFGQVNNAYTTWKTANPTENVIHIEVFTYVSSFVPGTGVNTLSGYILVYINNNQLK